MLSVSILALELFAVSVGFSGGLSADWNHSSSVCREGEGDYQLGRVFYFTT